VIERPPSEYLTRIWYDAVVYTRGVLELCIEAAGGAERVLFGSDYPHNLGDMAGCLARVNALGGTRAALIRGANAARLFAL
jgi:aminocarboxymuconate-semialdehyde decarboxylase